MILRRVRPFVTLYLAQARSHFDAASGYDTRSDGPAQQSLMAVVFTSSSPNFDSFNISHSTSRSARAGIADATLRCSHNTLQPCGMLSFALRITLNPPRPFHVFDRLPEELSEQSPAILSTLQKP
ncbi:hypothetical protein BD413DRAFT_189922 [Trametes elegans]|nr:hypothetical protein BD413DRAFT_189922 [Trametes elegans]